MEEVRESLSRRDDKQDFTTSVPRPVSPLPLPKSEKRKPEKKSRNPVPKSRVLSSSASSASRSPSASYHIASPASSHIMCPYPNRASSSPSPTPPFGQGPPTPHRNALKPEKAGYCRSSNVTRNTPDLICSFSLLSKSHPPKK